MHYVLLYQYVEGILEKRKPFREKHLAILEELYDQGQVIMAGAWANPPDGAAIVFQADNADAVQQFVTRDPYMANGLVLSHSIKEWTVVVGVPSAG